MSAPKNFRSAFNGFNREDVVKYIEYMNSLHTTQLNEASMEVEFLKGKLAAAEAVPAQDPALLEQLNGALQTISSLEEQCARLTRELEDAQARAREAEVLTRQRDDALAEAEKARLAQAAAAAQELEAYRRAERTERVARERAEQVYSRVNGVLADATVKVDEAAGQIGQVSEQILSRLNQLQSAVVDSRQALQEAAQTMYAIRPTGEDPE